jgi:orotate phosphoribosyltransferase
VRDRGADLDELLEIVKRRSFRRGKFILSSGKESELYFNMKPTMMDPRGAYLSACAFLDRIKAEKADYVGGLEMGAVPIIAALAAISEAKGSPVKTFFVRKAAKAHGTKDVLEGLGPDDSLQGKHVVVADDVATSGSSILKAADEARAAGAIVEVALCLVNRDEGADQFLADRGLRLVSVLHAGDFI